MLTTPAGVTSLTVPCGVVGDVEVAGGVEGQADGTAEPGGEGADHPAGVTSLTVPSPCVGDVEVAGDRRPGRGLVEPGGEGGDGGGTWGCP